MKRGVNRAARRAFEVAMARYRFFESTLMFSRRYSTYDKWLFAPTLSQEVLRDYAKRWSSFGLRVEAKTFLLSYNLSGVIDRNIVPENIFAAVIEPALNRYKDRELSFLSVKNIYEKWFGVKAAFPKCVIHKIDGVLYDADLRVIQNVTSFLSSRELDYPFICKPSVGGSGGAGVQVVRNASELVEYFAKYQNVVCQERIVQFAELSRVDPGLNTVRVCLYRTQEGRFAVLNCAIRFGVNGSLDNETSGGVVCYIHRDGRLNSYAVNKRGEKFENHPNSGIEFGGLPLPSYDKLLAAAEYVANKVVLCNLVSLDMCLDEKGCWRCIEINLKAQTIRFSQYAGAGFFGDFTDEVMTITSGGRT